MTDLTMPIAYEWTGEGKRLAILSVDAVTGQRSVESQTLRVCCMCGKRSWESVMTQWKYSSIRWLPSYGVKLEYCPKHKYLCAEVDKTLQATLAAQALDLVRAVSGRVRG